MLWGAVFTLGPYLFCALVIAGWAFCALPAEGPPQMAATFGLVRLDSPRDEVLFALSLTAPFAVLATGVAWLVVLLLGATRARAWSPPIRGGIGASICWVCAIPALLIWL